MRLSDSVRVEDLTEALWGTRVSPSTVSKLNTEYLRPDRGLAEPTHRGRAPYHYLVGIVMKRSWAGEVRSVSLLVASAVNSEGFREILGICEGAKEDKSGWSPFLRHLVDRGPKGVQLIISDACRGLTESAADYLPETRWQRCMVHFYRNVFSQVPATRVREVSHMLKAIHAQENVMRPIARRERSGPDCELPANVARVMCPGPSVASEYRGPLLTAPNGPAENAQASCKKWQGCRERCGCDVDVIEKCSLVCVHGTLERERVEALQRYVRDALKRESLPTEAAYRSNDNSVQDHIEYLIAIAAALCWPTCLEPVNCAHTRRRRKGLRNRAAETLDKCELIALIR